MDPIILPRIRTLYEVLATIYFDILALIEKGVNETDASILDSCAQPKFL